MAEIRLEGRGMHVEAREFRVEKREDTCREMRRYVATIGFFDGVHRGHQYLIGQLRREASALGLGSMLVTLNGEIGRAVQQECRDRSRMPSSA